MDRKKYGAFLLLSAVFILVFFMHSSDVLSLSSQNENETAENKNLSTSMAGPVENGAPQTPIKTNTYQKKADKASHFPGFPIDINKATREELMLLPGIGEKTAERIIEKRAELHGFSSVEDLTEVKWIGKVKLERIRGLVTVKETPRKEG